MKHRETVQTLLLLGASVLILLFLPAPGAAQEAQPASSEEAAIRKMVQQYEDAFNRADVQAIGDRFIPTADYMDDTGRVMRGREAIAQSYRDFFAQNKKLKIKVTVNSVRLLTPDVAIADGFTQAESSTEPVRGRFSVVYVKQNGSWLVASVREVTEQRASRYDRLKDLEWLIGEWEDQDPAARVRTAFAWGENKNWILVSFTVKHRNGDVISGTARIGWDPLRNQVRSWVFDTEGGHIEGYWLRKDNTWTVTCAGFTGEGGRASCVNTYTYVDKNTYLWKSANRLVNGAPDPDIPEIKVVRVPPSGSASLPTTKENP
jgi:uncharacterized protein (TIGR02246 family)